MDFIGIDPGKSGGMCLMDYDANIVDVFTFAATGTHVKKTILVLPKTPPGVSEICTA